MSLLATLAATARNIAVHPMRWLRRAMRWALGLVLLAWVVMVVAWLALHWLILPHIDEWRPDIERRVSAGLGAHLTIGSIHVESGGWMPTLELGDVRLLDAQGRAALLLPRVVATLSAESLLAFEPRFAQLVLIGPDLDVRRDAQGRVFVAGIGVDAGAKSGSTDAMADWLFAQHELAIQQGRVRWTDERRDAPALELNQVSFVLRNGLRS
ncbi:MAG TPA: AsmA family protein, partial [Burkholderiaceae bacterium]